MNQPATSTGEIAVTAGTQQVTGPGVLLHAELLGGTTANAFTIYDGTSTAGLKLVNVQNVTAGVAVIDDLAQGVVFNTGLFVVVSGTGSKGIAHYRIGA